VSRGFGAFERGDYAAAIAAFEPVADELQRVGGSRAQLDLIEFTLLQAYLHAERPDAARRMLGARGRGSSRLPVAGLAALH
jgi:cytochrome c-type biogenesis protein CcmH/NrfG